MSSIVLYDIDRKEPRACWSPNVWKIRFVLNYKKLDYETEWLEFPDIAPTLKAGNFPKPEPGMNYTCPAVLLRESGAKTTPLMDSLSIARMLEKSYPEPSLLLESSVLSEVEALVGQLMKHFGPIVLPMMKADVWNAASLDYKEDQVAAFFGLSIDQISSEKGGEAAWEKLQEPLEKLAALLKQKEGPFILGNEVSYADFMVASLLQSGRRIGNGEIYDRLVSIDNAFESLYEATKEWAKRDDY